MLLNNCWPSPSERIFWAFLNALLPSETGQGIVAIDIRNSEIPPSWQSGKGKRLDIPYDYTSSPRP